MKQLEVQIMGQSYLLGCPEGGDARLLDAVDKVDVAMCKIRDAGKIKAKDRIAVLAALNLAFELSDRTAAPAPSPAPSPPAPRPSEPQSALGGAANHPMDDAQIDALLNRLDTALGLDGRLL
jgi:cell division protein ZapA